MQGLPKKYAVFFWEEEAATKRSARLSEGRVGESVVCRDEDAGFVVKEIRERKGIFG